ncbi:MAG TPA: class I SAM-dependent methyltransferase [Candidatus Saccharimonadales bacterium]|nr:class I SAM-dependent methyltransferase [Candidatus Saccharimonadales bacterium]
MSEYLPRNVGLENRRQYHGANPTDLVVPYTADVRRYLYLKYALAPEQQHQKAAEYEDERIRNIWGEMADCFEAYKGKTILDAGTGNAYLLEMLLRRGHRGTLVGMDTSSSHFDFYQEILREKYDHEDIFLQHGDAQAMPFSANSFDAVSAPFLAYHLPRPRKLFSEVNRVLVPGGQAIFSGREVDNTFNLWTVAQLVAEHYDAVMPRIGAFYSHFPLSRMLQSLDGNNKFKVIDYKEQDETIYIPATDEGWNDFREAIFSLLPLMRLPNGQQPSKTDVIDYLELSSESNIRRDYFESLAREYGGYFPDHLQQGFVVVENLKKQ